MVFGIVAEGLDVLNRINEAYLDDKGRPLKNIRLGFIVVLVHIAEERLEDDWKPMDEVLGPAALEKALRAKEAQTNAVILESTGDIPDADIKPPDNVLFVCKLNPVTKDEDLYTIFSRFGTVTSADIIRDFKTGDSLCYAFIEGRLHAANGEGGNDHGPLITGPSHPTIGCNSHRPSDAIDP
ncbi:hypothetical protein QJS10_CPA09g00974 [Acorus calamus]|uniref:peptidylprolyl isomerase n=1 Tax=Acorus calamus TaxID=4465 RepID=A0AAV9E791_ACOCL|nr:hypothetical protein QJS10_CPA09g00974 [Acorus calamus]